MEIQVNNKRKVLYKVVLRNGLEGLNTEIKNISEIYEEVSKRDLTQQELWFIQNIDDSIGKETDTALHFGSGGSMRMFSIDQKYPRLNSDDVGQVWIPDCVAFNYMMVQKDEVGRNILLEEVMTADYDGGLQLWNNYLVGSTSHPFNLSPSMISSVTAKFNSQSLEERKRLARLHEYTEDYVDRMVCIRAQTLPELEIYPKRVEGRSVITNKKLVPGKRDFRDFSLKSVRK